MNSLPRIKWRFTGALLVSLFVIFGLILLIISILLGSGFWSELFNQLSTALLVGGLWSGVYELFLRDDFIKSNDENTEKILHKISLAIQEKNLGIIDMCVDADEFDNSELLEKSKILFVVLNDGRTWVSINSKKLALRFRDPDKSTVFFLLHPRSAMLAILAKKVGTNKESLENKIRETVLLLHQLKTSNTDLKIFGHFLYNPYSMTLGDKYAIVIPYFLSRRRQTMPLFRYENSQESSFYQKLKSDLELLLLDSEDISDIPFDQINKIESN